MAEPTEAQKLAKAWLAIRAIEGAGCVLRPEVACGRASIRASRKLADEERLIVRAFRGQVSRLLSRREFGKDIHAAAIGEGFPAGDVLRAYTERMQDATIRAAFREGWEAVGKPSGKGEGPLW
jgi:hypothetical protein